MPRQIDTKKKQARQLGIAILVLALLALVWGVWATLHRKDLSAWIRQVSAPIDAKVDAATYLYGQGQYDRAAAQFREALSLTRAARDQGREMLRASREQYRETTHFRTPDEIRDAARRTDVMALQILEADILYRLASTLWRQIQIQHNLAPDGTGSAAERRAPPPDKVLPVMGLLDEGIAVNPDNIHLRILKGQIALASGQFSLAIRELTEATRLDRDAAEAYNTLGIVYAHPVFQKTDQHDTYRRNAIEAFENAVTAGERRGEPLPDPHLNLGLYFSVPADPATPSTAVPGVADRERAIRHLRRYLELTKEAGASAPGYELARDRLRTLGAREE